MSLFDSLCLIVGHFTVVALALGIAAHVVVGIYDRIILRRRARRAEEMRRLIADALPKPIPLRPRLRIVHGGGDAA